MKKTCKIFTLAILFLAVFAFNAYAVTINIPADYTTIQAGIDAATNGDVVLVQPGTYVENINYNGKLITVASLFHTTPDPSYISQTIIDGNNSGCVVTFENGEDSTAIITGFTITNGYSQYGGGIHCDHTSPSIQYLSVTGNGSNYLGGGIYCNYSSPNIHHVTITDNSASGSGGGLLCSASSPYVKNVEISGNFGGNYGGGVYCLWLSDPTLENVTITDNDVTWYGSAIYCVSTSSPLVLNSIISDNLGTYAVYVSAGSPVLTYSDFWNNAGGNFFQCSAGTGCIDADPLFVDPLTGDYLLSWANFPTPDATKSPCIDTGDPASPLDPDGTRADMGAYYFNQDITGVDPQEISDFMLTNFPNPVSAHINDLSVSFSIQKPSRVHIQLFNIKGQIVETLVNEDKNVGEYAIDYKVNELSSGIYFTKMSVDGVGKEVKKVILLR